MKVVEINTIWKNYNKIPAYQHILFLMNKFNLLILTNDDFELLTTWDVEEGKVISDVERQWRSEIEDIKRTNRLWCDEEDQFYVERRSCYLKQEIEQANQYLNRYYQQANINRQRRLPFWIRSILLLFWHNEKTEQVLIKTQKELYRLEHRQEIKEGQITEQMIAIAKQYPFNKLIEFNRAGFTYCMYHNEKTPSLSLNRNQNYIHCFSCEVTKDTIAFVMDSMNKNFIEAVKYLNQ
jgi:hypothetical protein